MRLAYVTDYKKLLYKILQYFLLEIRSSIEEESPKKKIYALSRLVHYLPMVLLNGGGKSSPDYEEIYYGLLSRAEILGVGCWIKSNSE